MRPSTCVTPSINTHPSSLLFFFFFLYCTHSKEPKIRARMAKTTEDMIKQCMENVKRERDRKEKVERGEGSELEHMPLKI